MSAWFTVERISAVLRIVSMLAALWSGGQAVQGYHVVASRPDGVASASADDVKAVSGNAGLAALLGIVAANKKLIESLLKSLGVPDSANRVIGDVIDAGRLNNLRASFHLATTKAERDGIRSTASLVADEMFDSWFPAEKQEAAK